MQIQGLRIPPEQAQAFLEGHKDRELYRIVYLAESRPDESNLAAVMLAQITAHVWASDVRDAMQQFEAQDHAGSGLPVLFVLACQPAGGVEEDSMIERVALGPRAL